MKVSTKSKSLEHNWNWHLKNAIRDPNRLASELEISLNDFKSDFPLEHKKKSIEGTERYYEGKHLNGTNQLNLNTEYGSIKLIQN